ncbi:MAG TPA: pyruvate, water dikinase regulatory protein [Candidatus Dormibacteraeota bacterium]|nr:pyruvate, water dikinase regulatory protein [Candidatus Dormibacteraeota bacterium]
MHSNPVIYIISDSVGETAESVIKAGLSQFTIDEYHIRRIRYVDHKDTIKHTLKNAAEDHALIGFTLVDPELRKYLKIEAQKMNLEAIDIMGPVLDILERALKETPLLKPGLVHKLDEDYFRRVEAIEFAVKYDDGQDPRGIMQADIVLIGVSRTSKTPLSQYLALKGLKVANIPIVPEIDPPEELFKIDPSRCVGLTITPEKLNEIRKERLKALGLEDQAIYANIQRINEELTYYQSIVKHIGCEVVDVSSKAVEEIANIILHKIN